MFRVKHFHTIFHDWFNYSKIYSLKSKFKLIIFPIFFYFNISFTRLGHIAMLFNNYVWFEVISPFPMQRNSKNKNKNKTAFQQLSCKFSKTVVYSLIFSYVTIVEHQQTCFLTVSRNWSNRFKFKCRVIASNIVKFQTY